MLALTRGAWAEAVPTPRAKPQIAATLQLASADAQIVPAPKSKAESKPAVLASAEPKPQTPADIINARVYGGMHYRFSVEAGAHIGEQVADYVAANYFRPIDDDDHDVDDDNGGEDAESPRR